MKRIRNMAVCVIALGLFGLMGTAAQAQENRHVQIVNRASSPIYHLYASNVDRGTWEEDLLGDRVLLPGYWINANIDDGSGHCLFDMKAVLYDGRTAEIHGFNVCTGESWTVTN
ncbi:MAG: hypothetical protein ACLP59_14875 [Bryobacteraceae bacterium]